MQVFRIIPFRTAVEDARPASDAAVFEDCSTISGTQTKIHLKHADP